MASRFITNLKASGRYEIVLKTVEGKYAHGVSMLAIADYLKISEKTLYNLINKKHSSYDEGFAKALVRGNEDLYFGLLHMQVDAISNEDLPLPYRLELAEKIMSKYGHRYLLPEDIEALAKDKGVTINNNVEGQRVFVLGDEDEDEVGDSIVEADSE